MEHTFNPEEQISALADGELQGEAFAKAVEHASTDADARASWNAYHVVGEVLRSGHRSAHRGVMGADMAFVERLRAELAAPRPAVVDPVPLAPVLERREAANSPVWAWKAFAGFASVAAVAAIGWNVIGVQAPADAGQLARAGGQPSAVVAVAQPANASQAASASAAAPAPQNTQQPVQLASGEPNQVMIRDPRLDELLAAHKQAGGASALQMPSGFLRNATFEGPAR